MSVTHFHIVRIILKHPGDRSEAAGQAAMVQFLDFRPCKIVFSITPECTYRMFDPNPCCVDVTYYVAASAPIPYSLRA
jgi:hypothetical protein